MSITIALPAAERVTQVLFVVVLTLTACSILGQVSRYFLGHPQLKGCIPAFYVDEEANIPTWYSSFALLLAASLLASIAAIQWRRRAPYFRHWIALSGIFLLLSVDEVAMLHEYPIDWLREPLQAGGFLYYTWVLPGMAFVIAFAACFLSFLHHLPRSTGRLVAVAGLVFVGGAIGVEMISGLQADLHGENNFAYAMIVSVEEFMEMLGVVIFIHALVAYVHDEVGGLQVRLGAEADRLPSAPAAGRLADVEHELALLKLAMSTADGARPAEWEAEGEEAHRVARAEAGEARECKL